MLHTPIAPATGAAECTDAPELGFAPMPAVAAVLSRFQPDQLASFIEVAIGLLDVAEPDPDEPDFAPRSDGMPGDPGDHEPGGDEEKAAWIEWTSMRGAAKRGANSTYGEEDDEEDDPSGVCDEDGINTKLGIARSSQPGCIIADPDYCTAGEDKISGGESVYPGDDVDSEEQQMLHDVPMLQTFSLDHNPFTDKREHLGITNLQTSFRTNGGEVRSADSGAMLSTKGLGEKLGVPV